MMFVSRSKYLDLQARCEQLLENLADTRDEREAFRKSATKAAHQFAEADATVKRLSGRNERLAGLLRAADSQSEAAYVAQLERRLERLARGTGRWMAALWAERAESLRLAHRADRAVSAELLQARAHARALEKRLAEVTAANQACTCGGGAS